MAFQSFKRATRPKDVKYLQAVMKEGELEQAAQQQVNALRTQGATGAMGAYNAAMEDKGRSPIADYLFGADAAATGVEPVAEAELISSMAASEGPGLATSGLGAAETAVGAEVAAPIAAEAGAGTAGGLMSGPVGWAAMALAALLASQ